MAFEIDPEGVEPAALLAVEDFNRGRVLEVGCGNGRLSFRYGKKASCVIGIDPKPDEVLSARNSCPAELRHCLRFTRGSATSLPFRTETFHIALLASAL